jgi:hypothetical protein
MYVYIYIIKYIYIYTYMQICKWWYINTCILLNVYVQIHMFMYTPECMYEKNSRFHSELLFSLNGFHIVSCEKLTVEKEHFR